MHSIYSIGSDDFDFEPASSRRSSQTRFTTKNRPKWNNNWPFEADDDNKSSTTTNEHKFPSMFQQRSNIDNPFMMFEMLTRAVFDKFFNDDLFWHHLDVHDSLHNSNSQGIHFPNLNPHQTSRTTSSRLRSASQQRPSASSTNRTRIHVNHVPSSSKQGNEMHFEWLGHHPRQKRTSSTSRFDHKDSDEENSEENYVYQQTKPTTINGHRLRRRQMNHNHESKAQACQYCFQPSTSLENRLQHEAVCRQRPNKTSTNYRTRTHPAPPPPPTTTSNDEKLFTSKCSYCHQEVRLTDRLDHEALCKQFGNKRQTTTNSSTKRFNNSTSNSLNGDSQTPLKPSSGNRMNQPSSDTTTN